MKKSQLLFHTIFFILGLFSFSKAQNPYSKNFIDSSKIILKECINQKNTDCYFKNCIKIADAFLYLGKNDSALFYLNKISVNELSSTNFNFEYNYQLGRIYSAKGLYFSALQYTYKSLFYAEKLNGNIYKAKSYSLLANINGLLNNNKEALSWHFKALPIYKSISLFEKYYLTINNMGNCYKRLQEFSKAINLYQTALSYRLKTDNKFWQGALYSNIGNTFLQKKDYKNALLFTKKSLVINALLNDSMSIFINKVQITKAFLEIGDNQLSLKAANEAELISKNIDMVDQKMELLELLSKIHQNNNNTVLALSYLKKFNELKDKRYEDELEKKIAAQKVDYELLNEKQNSENQKTTIEIQNKNYNFLMGTAILLLAFLILFFYFYQNQKKQNKIIFTQSEQIKENNLQLEQKVVQRTSELMIANQNLLSKNEEIENALFLGKKEERNQIAGQLHDNLGGYLSAIRYNLMALDFERLENNEKKIFDNIRRMINTAHDEVRYLSHNIMPKDLEDQGIVFCLIKLAKQLSETGKIEFLYHGPKILKIDLKTEYELYSICLELTNNILKHAKATKGGYLIETKEHKKTIYVFDNGIGLQDSENGFGLDNIKTKLHKINATLCFNSHLPANFKNYSTVIKIEI